MNELTQFSENVITLDSMCTYRRTVL